MPRLSEFYGIVVYMYWQLRRSELEDNWDRAQAPTKLVPIEPFR